MSGPLRSSMIFCNTAIFAKQPNNHLLHWTAQFFMVSVHLSSSSAQSPVDDIRIAYKTLENISLYAIDFMNISELLSAVVEHLPRFETTAIEQIRYSAPTLIRQQVLYHFPDLLLVSRILPRDLSCFP